jgi:hypothetical protein
MNADGYAILRHLHDVWVERDRRDADPRLLACVTWVKTFQQSRFRRTYADLLTGPPYAAAASFFLDELYGPADFSSRDRQFERVVPSLVRLFPSEVVGTVRSLAELHAISEQLDTRMGANLLDVDRSAETYVQAWSKVGEAGLRSTQVALTLKVGQALDRLTRKPFLRTTLRAMRAPAQVAGLADLQRFLEAGFDTFRSMPDAHWFLETIRERESLLIESLFEGKTTLL